MSIDMSMELVGAASLDMEAPVPSTPIRPNQLVVVQEIEDELAVTAAIMDSLASSYETLADIPVEQIEIDEQMSENHLSRSSTDGTSNWRKRANCLGLDPDMFFPERGASTKGAKEVCKACVVKDDCLEYAVQRNEKMGVWGGVSKRAITRIRKQRGL